MRGEGVSRPLWSRRAGQQVWRGGRVLPSGEEYEQQGSRCGEGGEGEKGRERGGSRRALWGEYWDGIDFCPVGVCGCSLSSSLPPLQV